VKKKVLYLVLVFSLTEFIGLTNSVVGFECNLFYLDTSSDYYYINENLELNSSWILDYNPNMEIAYTQVRIFNAFNDLIWNSSKYKETGFIIKNWSIDIKSFNLSFTQNSSVISIKFFSYYYHIGTMNMVSTYLETIQVTINKRTPLCQLIGFKDRITFGDPFFFKAKFLDSTSVNNSHLINRSILLKIISNNSIIYCSNFTTNQLGIVEISISSTTHLSIGTNILIFIMTNDDVYNDSRFFYQVFLEKNPILMNIISIKDRLRIDEDLEGELFYYYFFNNSLTSLNNQHIQLEIFDKQTSMYSKIYTTDNFGKLILNLSQDLFNFNKESKDLVLNLTFNGTLFLGNHSYSINIHINDSTIIDGFNSNILIIISVLTISPLVSIPLLSKLRKERKKILANITIRE
jgi:hypothetical protein